MLSSQSPLVPARLRSRRGGEILRASPLVIAVSLRRPRRGSANRRETNSHQNLHRSGKRRGESFTSRRPLSNNCQARVRTCIHNSSANRWPRVRSSGVDQASRGVRHEFEAGDQMNEIRESGKNFGRIGAKIVKVPSKYRGPRPSCHDEGFEKIDDPALVGEPRIARNASRRSRRADPRHGQ